MKEVLDFLKESRVFYVATIEGDQPRVRPFGAVCEFEGKIYLITANCKAVFAELTANPKLEISCMTPDGRWLRLAAEAVRDERFAAKKAMLDANPDLRGMYHEDDGVMEVFYLTHAEASICSFTEAPINYRF